MKTRASDRFDPFWVGKMLQCNVCSMYMEIETGDHLLPNAMLGYINDPTSPFNGYVEEFKVACPRCGTIASAKVKYLTKEENENNNKS